MLKSILRLLGVCGHGHRYRSRDAKGRLGLTCDACGHWTPINLPMGELGARLRRRMKTQGRDNVVPMRKRA